MLHLADFFSPLNFANLSIFLIFMVTCEIVGYSFAKLFFEVIPNFLRGSVWLFGLGVVVFVNFVLHFIVPFSSPLIPLAILTVLSLSSRSYVRDRAWKTLFEYLNTNKLPLILVVIVLPKVFVKTSLPPYIWDEMAYHFMPPYMVTFEKIWDFGSGFLLNLPRLMDTAYISLFSLTKTYAVARFLHFSIFITFLIASYAFLKERFGKMVGLLYFALMIYFPQNFLLWSTFGYVDVATMSFIILGLLSALDFLDNRDVKLVLYGLAFFSLAIGAKYSALTAFIIFGIVSVFGVFKYKKIKILNKRWFGIALFTIVFMGGYWYVKNLVITGNPVYPFLFSCHFEACDQFSLGYTLPFTISNFSAIYSQLTVGSVFLKYTIPLSIIFSLVFGSVKIRRYVMVLMLFIVAELTIVRFISGYEVRYFYHWQAILALLVVFPVSLLYKQNE